MQEIPTNQENTNYFPKNSLDPKLFVFLYANKDIATIQFCRKLKLVHC